MERLDKLINILKLTPHRQPELVKEAANRILARSLRYENQIGLFLKPLIEILISYCDDDDSAQRSLFNDYLNSVILTFQHQHFQLILSVLCDEVAINRSARKVSAALNRIPPLVQNVLPIEFCYDTQKLLKSFIEVAKRSDDEIVLKALDSTLKHVMPYLDYDISESKDSNNLSKLLVEVIISNLSNESSQIRRLAASSLANICLSSKKLLKNTLERLKLQLDLLSDIKIHSINSFIGFCQCVKEIPDLVSQNHELIVQIILKYIELDSNDISLISTALETLRYLFKYQLKTDVLKYSTELISNKFLFQDIDGQKTIRKDTRVILQAEALACISSIIKQRPIILDQLETVFQFRNHADIAIRNQLVNIISNYIEASWRFPNCIEMSVSCENIRKLWIELRSILMDENAHPDTLKTCIIGIKNCINELLESDHCLHIVEHQDLDNIIQLYQKSNFKPFKIEVLSLFGSLNYRTLHYLERVHWSKIRSQTAGSFINRLEDRIINDIMIASLIDEHQRVRKAASSALIEALPNFYITDLNNGFRGAYMQRCRDPIVSLADDLADKHLVAIELVEEHSNCSKSSDESSLKSDIHETQSTNHVHKVLSSSIIPLDKNDNFETSLDKNRRRMIVTINLKHIVGLLKLSIENNLEKGKAAISSIVRTFYELSLIYPVHQYPISWDCRPSEYCEAFTLLNFMLTYLENMNEPDVVVEDLDAYKNFLMFSHQLLFGLCHECVLNEYKHQKVKPFHKRQSSSIEGSWPELVLKHSGIADLLQIYFTHLTKLLWLLSFIIEEKTNPFAISSKQNQAQPQKSLISEKQIDHETLISNRLLFNRLHRKLESSFRSSKKNLNQKDEKFYQILETCILNLSSLLEFIGMNKSVENVRDILAYLKVTSSVSGESSIICARQLLKSIFGINILALYQVDPNDWFEDESWSSTPSYSASQDNIVPYQEGVYHNLISDPYKFFSSFYSMNRSQITPNSDKALAVLNFESRRALKVRQRIEERVSSLFEFNPNQIISLKVRQASDILKSTIMEFTPIVTECMKQFSLKGFCQYQTETLNLMSYLLLLRVNYQKLPLAGEFVNSINRLLDQCGEKVFSSRENMMGQFLRSSFTFLTLLTYERGPTKPLLQVASVIQKFDDIRAKLSVSKTNSADITTYIVPLLRCLVEDLFIYRTKQFQKVFNYIETGSAGGDGSSYELGEHNKDIYEVLEAERETVAQKLLDVIDNPEVYDLLSILIWESRQNSNEIKYKKLSQHLLSVIPNKLSQRNVSLTNYKAVELTRRIIENISPEVFQPINFIFETLLQFYMPPPNDGTTKGSEEFHRWMSLVIIAIHILTTHVKEEEFLTRMKLTISEEIFVEYLLHIAQLCLAEIFIRLNQADTVKKSSTEFLIQQLSCYILYLTNMFQSGFFFQMSKVAIDLIKRETKNDTGGPKKFEMLCLWARDPENGFSISSCEELFFHIRLIYPDITVLWSNVMMLINNVDCNRDYWRNLLIYECHQCQNFENMTKSIGSMNLGSSNEDSSADTNLEEIKTEDNFKRGVHINRPSSLNLSDISFSDQLRRSFIKKIATAETRDKAFNRNIVETSDEEGRLLEREVNLGNTEQCLSPNVELSRRGALCLVLDYVTISMNDVEHITWLIIHHINDIIRWSHELPITDFVNAVHGKSASSGIFIQAINSGFNNLTSISLVTRLLWTLEKVHYTQYGSLVVLLVEKLLSAQQLTPYRSLTKKIEDFACATVQKLLDETNRSLVTTNDEVINQLCAQDLDRIISLLDIDLYPKLAKSLDQLRESTKELVVTPKVELHNSELDSDDDSEEDEINTLYVKANLIYWLSEQNWTANISTLFPAMNVLRTLLSDPKILARLNNDRSLVCFLISAIYSLALTILPPPTRLVRPKFWSNQEEKSDKVQEFSFERKDATPRNKPMILMGSKRSAIKPKLTEKPTVPRLETISDQMDSIENVRMACLKGLFLVENIEYLNLAQCESLIELVVCVARLPLINSFVLTPPLLWKQGLLVKEFDEADLYRTDFPMVTHDILSKDHAILENFCARLLRLGWINRRQFEEIWMTLLGVLSATLSNIDNSKQNTGYNAADSERKANLLASCRVVTTITKFLLLAKHQIPGNPLSPKNNSVQSFEDRAIGLTKSIATNLSGLRKRIGIIFELLEGDKSHKSKIVQDATSSPDTPLSESTNSFPFNNFLGLPAQKLRMSSILNIELSMHDTVVIDNVNDSIQKDEVDVESCIRLLLSIYKQKIKDPTENLCTPSLGQESPSSQHKAPNSRQLKNRPNQLAPPLTTAICQSVLALSDLFTEFDQFEWLFDIFVQTFKLAERNEDEIQMQYLIVGLCKSATICCYDLPSDLINITAINHRDVVFEKCRQSIEKCLKSEFVPLKINALYGLFYMLEDSINIVASGAWELDTFKRLRLSRFAWILKLMPLLLDKENFRLLTKKTQIHQLLESLYETVQEYELKSMKP